MPQRSTQSQRWMWTLVPENLKSGGRLTWAKSFGVGDIREGFNGGAAFIFRKSSLGQIKMDMEVLSRWLKSWALGIGQNRI